MRGNNSSLVHSDMHFQIILDLSCLKWMTNYKYLHNKIWQKFTFKIEETNTVRMSVNFRSLCWKKCDISEAITLWAKILTRAQARILKLPIITSFLKEHLSSSQKRCCQRDSSWARTSAQAIMVWGPGATPRRGPGGSAPGSFGVLAILNA